MDKTKPKRGIESFQSIVKTWKENIKYLLLSLLLWIPISESTWMILPWNNASLATTLTANNWINSDTASFLEDESWEDEGWGDKKKWKKWKWKKWKWKWNKWKPVIDLSKISPEIETGIEMQYHNKPYSFDLTDTEQWKDIIEKITQWANYTNQVTWAANIVITNTPNLPFVPNVDTIPLINTDSLIINNDIGKQIKTYLFQSLYLNYGPGGASVSIGNKGNANKKEAVYWISAYINPIKIVNENLRIGHFDVSNALRLWIGAYRDDSNLYKFIPNYTLWWTVAYPLLGNYIKWLFTYTKTKEIQNLFFKKPTSSLMDFNSIKLWLVFSLDNNEECEKLASWFWANTQIGFAKYTFDKYIDPNNEELVNAANKAIEELNLISSQAAEKINQILWSNNDFPDLSVDTLNYDVRPEYKSFKIYPSTEIYFWHKEKYVYVFASTKFWSSENKFKLLGIYWTIGLNPLAIIGFDPNKIKVLKKNVIVNWNEMFSIYSSISHEWILPKVYRELASIRYWIDVSLPTYLTPRSSIAPFIKIESNLWNKTNKKGLYNWINLWVKVNFTSAGPASLDQDIVDEFKKIKESNKNQKKK